MWPKPMVGRDIAAPGRYAYVVEPGSGLTVRWFSPPITTSLSTAGGTQAAPADPVTQTFAAGVFSDTVTMTCSALARGWTLPVPAGLVHLGRAFEITAWHAATRLPAGPAAPYTPTVGYSDAQRGPAVEESLALFRWDGQAWPAEPSSRVDADVNHLAAAPVQPGRRAVFGTARRTFLPVVHRRWCARPA